MMILFAIDGNKMKGNSNAIFSANPPFLTDGKFQGRVITETLLQNENPREPRILIATFPLMRTGAILSRRGRSSFSWKQIATNVPLMQVSFLYGSSFEI